jgi:hypothetical protein
VAKTEGALRLGVLGAANITSAALINPATSHPDVVVFAVAARDKTRAQAQATKCGIPKVHGSYQGMTWLALAPSRIVCRSATQSSWTTQKLTPYTILYVWDDTTTPSARRLSFSSQTDSITSGP